MRKTSEDRGSKIASSRSQSKGKIRSSSTAKANALFHKKLVTSLQSHIATKNSSLPKYQSPKN